MRYGYVYTQQQQHSAEQHEEGTFIFLVVFHATSENGENLRICIYRMYITL